MLTCAGVDLQLRDSHASVGVREALPLFSVFITDREVSKRARHAHNLNDGCEDRQIA